jgi:hypothetical protein
MIDYMACVKHIAQQEASARGVMDATPYPARALESWGHLPPPPWQDLCSKSAAVSQAGRYQPGDSREAQQDRCAACTASPRACAHSGVWHTTPCCWCSPSSTSRTRTRAWRRPAALDNGTPHHLQPWRVEHAETSLSRSTSAAPRARLRLRNEPLRKRAPKHEHPARRTCLTMKPSYPRRTVHPSCALCSLNLVPTRAAPKYEHSNETVTSTKRRKVEEQLPESHFSANIF